MTLSARIPTRWWPIADTTRNWIPSWPLALRSLRLPSLAVRRTRASTARSKHTTTASAVSTQYLDSVRWLHTSTDTSSDRRRPTIDSTVRSFQQRSRDVSVCHRYTWTFSIMSCANNDLNIFYEWEKRLVPLGLWQRDEMNTKYLVWFLRWYVIQTVFIDAVMWWNISIKQI